MVPSNRLQLDAEPERVGETECILRAAGGDFRAELLDLAAHGPALEGLDLHAKVIDAGGLARRHPCAPELRPRNLKPRLAGFAGRQLCTEELAVELRRLLHVSD